MPHRQEWHRFLCCGETALHLLQKHRSCFWTRCGAAPCGDESTAMTVHGASMTLAAMPSGWSRNHVSAPDPRSIYHQIAQHAVIPLKQNRCRTGIRSESVPISVGLSARGNNEPFIGSGSADRTTVDERAVPMVSLVARSPGNVAIMEPTDGGSMINCTIVVSCIDHIPLPLRM